MEVLDRTDTQDVAESWIGRTAVVTGATGFLGAWLVGELVRRGAHVVGITRDSSRPWRHGVTTQPKLVAARLEDRAGVEHALAHAAPDTVFHLGGQPIVGIANRDPVATFEANIQGTWNLLEACRRAGTVKRVVVASSDKAYGIAKRLPLEETMPLRGSHPYDVSKSCADLIARTYFETYGLNVCVTRCGNVFGGGDLNWNRIVPGVIRAVLGGERPVIRSDGSMVRDYIYVRDVVGAYLSLAARMDAPGAAGEAFNFSVNRPLSVIEMVTEILDIMGVRDTLPPMILNQASAEIQQQYLSPEKARRILGWTPRWTLRDALIETIDWYRRDHEKATATGAAE